MSLGGWEKRKQFPFKLSAGQFERELLLSGVSLRGAGRTAGCGPAAAGEEDWRQARRT